MVTPNKWQWINAKNITLYLLAIQVATNQGGGCWFCYNATIRRYINIRSDFPEYWQALRNLYYETNSTCFKYDKSLEQIEKLMDAYEFKEKSQLKLFEDNGNSKQNI